MPNAAEWAASPRDVSVPDSFDGDFHPRAGEARGERGTGLAGADDESVEACSGHLPLMPLKPVLSASSRHRVSFRQPCFSQAGGERGEIFRPADREPIFEIGDA
jgi:hypothetical protein